MMVCGVVMLVGTMDAILSLTVNISLLVLFSVICIYQTSPCVRRTVWSTTFSQLESFWAKSLIIKMLF